MKKHSIRTTSVRLLTSVVCLAATAAHGAEPPGLNYAFSFPGTAPNLATGADGTVVLSYIANNNNGHSPAHSLSYKILAGPKTGDRGVVTRGPGFFVNWADFPSVVPLSSDRWAAHWLVSQPAGGYAYDIYLSLSEDAGATWSEPFILHDDGTATEHGFVTLYPAGTGVGAVWLDGRNMDSGMTLRGATVDGGGRITGGQVIDDLTCDCCQTDVALTRKGPVAVYRDRTRGEIRDIYISRFADGAWQPGKPVANDNWQIAGCPVNGPVVNASGDNVIVTWFTAADARPAVKSAWSRDAGLSFSEPLIIADDRAVGHAGAVLIGADTAIASWLCRNGDGMSICYRSVGLDGTLGPRRQIATEGTVPRMSVPQIARIDEDLLIVWTDRADNQSVVSGARIPIER